MEAITTKALSRVEMFISKKFCNCKNIRNQTADLEPAIWLFCSNLWYSKENKVFIAHQKSLVKWIKYKHCDPLYRYLFLILNKTEWAIECSEWKGRNFHVEKCLICTCIWYSGDLFVCLSMLQKMFDNFWMVQFGKIIQGLQDSLDYGWVALLPGPHHQRLGQNFSLSLSPLWSLVLLGCVLPFIKRVWQVKQKCERDFLFGINPHLRVMMAL